jgi:hypothetical protein
MMISDLLLIMLVFAFFIAWPVFAWKAFSNFRASPRRVKTGTAFAAASAVSLFFTLRFVEGDLLLYKEYTVFFLNNLDIFGSAGSAIILAALLAVIGVVVWIATRGSRTRG